MAPDHDIRLSVAVEVTDRHGADPAHPTGDHHLRWKGAVPRVLQHREVAKVAARDDDVAAGSHQLRGAVSVQIAAGQGVRLLDASVDRWPAESAVPVAEEH